MKIKALLTAGLIATVPMMSAYADNDLDDRIEAGVLQDANYTSNVQKATKILEGKGYSVVKIEADAYKKSRFAKPVPALQADVLKGAVEYDVVLTYPDLKIVKEKIDN